MNLFQLLPVSQSHRLNKICRSTVVAARVTMVGMILFWPKMVFPDEPSISPFSLVKQYTQLSRDDLREIFFGRRTRWPDGSPLRVFVLPDRHPVHVRFVKEILEIYPYQLRSAWDRMLYSGTGTPPVEVDSLQEMQEKIEQNPGAIGYIEK